MQQQHIQKSSQNINKIEQFIKIIDTRILYYKDVLEKTEQFIQFCKKNDILDAKEHLKAMSKLQSSYNIIDKVINEITISTVVHKNETSDKTNTIDKQFFIDNLQQINNNISIFFKKYGTLDLTDLLKICIGNSYIEHINEQSQYVELFNILTKYCHPISFEIKNTDTITISSHKPLISIHNYSSLTSNNFYIKCHSITASFINNDKLFNINMICQNTNIHMLNNPYITPMLKQLRDNKPNIQEPNIDIIFDEYVNSISLKSILCNSIKEHQDIFAGIINQNKLFKQKTLNTYVKEFSQDSIFNKRNKIFNLLLYSHNPEYYHIAYLLFDLLSSTKHKYVDSSLQHTIYDSYTLNIQKKLINSIKKTIKFNKSLLEDDIDIPMEQQISLLNVSDNVKQKALTKLKEVQVKGDEAGSKAKQYLDGLLKIPFGTYRNEDVLNIIRKLKIHQ